MTSVSVEAVRDACKQFNEDFRPNIQELGKEIPTLGGMAIFAWNILNLDGQCASTVSHIPNIEQDQWEYANLVGRRVARQATTLSQPHYNIHDRFIKSIMRDDQTVYTLRSNPVTSSSRVAVQLAFNDTSPARARNKYGAKLQQFLLHNKKDLVDYIELLHDRPLDVPDSFTFKLDEPTTPNTIVFTSDMVDSTELPSSRLIALRNSFHDNPPIESTDFFKLNWSNGDQLRGLHQIPPHEMNRGQNYARKIVETAGKDAAIRLLGNIAIRGEGYEIARGDHPFNGVMSPAWLDTTSDRDTTGDALYAHARLLKELNSQNDSQSSLLVIPEIPPKDTCLDQISDIDHEIIHLS